MNEEKKPWRVNREVSVGDAVAFISALIIALSSYFLLSSRVSVIETAFAAHKEADDKSDTRVTEAIKSLDEKIDRLLEFNNRRGR